jgi:hypothetical protein
MAKRHQQVQVVARYEVKRNGHVVYAVRSSNGKDTYCTTVIEGHATGCTCPSRKPCYHMAGCEALESRRVVIRVGNRAVSGTTASHAVAKSLRLLCPVVAPQSVPQMPTECPASAVALSVPVPTTPSHAEQLAAATNDEERRAIWKRVDRDARIRDKAAAVEYWEKVHELRRSA